MRLYGLSLPLRADVPNFQFLVVADGSEFILVMLVPAHVLNDLAVGLESYQRIHCVCKLILLVDVPQTNSTVVTAGEQEPSLLWIPVKPVSLPLVAEQDQLWLYFVIGWIDSVFEIVKYVYFP